ncbi:MAG: FtsB family cell division protein [Bdellovibrionota bacterium]
MKKLAPHIIFLASFFLLGMIYLDKDSMPKVNELRETLNNQERINYALIREIRDYKKEIIGIQDSDRALEKVLRDEYALGKDGEVIVVFKEKR